MNKEQAQQIITDLNNQKKDLENRIDKLDFKKEQLIKDLFNNFEFLKTLEWTECLYGFDKTEKFIYLFSEPIFFLKSNKISNKTYNLEHIDVYINSCYGFTLRLKFSNLLENLNKLNLSIDYIYTKVPSEVGKLLKYSL